jgi:hypothetical protein
MPIGPVLHFNGTVVARRVLGKKLAFATIQPSSVSASTDDTSSSSGDTCTTMSASLPLQEVKFNVATFVTPPALPMDQGFPVRRSLLPLGMQVELRLQKQEDGHMAVRAWRHGAGSGGAAITTSSNIEEEEKRKQLPCSDAPDADPQSPQPAFMPALMLKAGDAARCAGFYMLLAKRLTWKATATKTDISAALACFFPVRSG